MKRFIALLLFVFCVWNAKCVLADSNVRVEFNTMEAEFDQPAVISENRALVPMRGIFELLGAEVSWNGETRTVTSVRYGKTVTVTIGESKMYVDGKAKELDVPAKIVNNRTLVPLRAISEAYECDVLWDDKERCAEIYSMDFLSAEKTEYSGEDGVSFEYFADTALKSSDGGVSVSAGKCIVTVSCEESADIRIDDEYVELLKKGLKGFSSMTVKSVRSQADKNAVLISCYNKGNTIYYLYANKNGISYNLALTVPDGAEKYDAEKLMYVIKSFLKTVS